jgi:aryl-alcohol dehydrogenase-like predicted oxidoreductase
LEKIRPGYQYSDKAMDPKPKMNLRTFSTSGRQVSEIGLGCWQLGGADWGAIDDGKAFEILATAMDSGITFFDTADVYGAGRSEELIGRFLRQNPSEVFVATKLGRTPELFPNRYTQAAMRAATENSLRRLGVEALDLTQLHCIPTAMIRRGEVFDWLRRLQQEGKIQRFGASVESNEEALICLQHEGLASLQIIFNVLRQKPAFHVLEEARKRGVAIIVRLPLASGVLSGKMTLTTQFPPN